MPVAPNGMLYDLLDAVQSHLANMGQAAVPIYVISPGAEQSLAYSNILSEWLTKHLQDKTLLPEWPFAHSELAKAGRIIVLNSITALSDAGIRTPSVVFAGHPSLRCGDMVHLAAHMGTSSRHSLILTGAHAKA